MPGRGFILGSSGRTRPYTCNISSLCFWLHQSISLFFTISLLICAVFHDFLEQIRRIGFFPLMKRIVSGPVAQHDDDCIPEGWALQPHQVDTKDGYLLTTYRLHKTEGEIETNKCAVLLQHGMFQSHIPFVLNRPQYSLAFLLVEAGYDVFLGNNRGNMFSRRHVKYSEHSDEFWNFGIDELALDVEANVNYVYGVHKKKLIYVGHSQGSAQVLAALSSNTDLQSKVKIMVCLAPGAFIHPIPSKALNSLACLNRRFQGIIFTLFGNRSFMPFIELVRDHFGGLVPLSVMTYLAYTMFHDQFEWSVSSWDPQRVQLYFQETPAGTSTKSVAHYLQLSLTGKFSMYDFGVEGNKIKYGTAEVPNYRVENIKIPSVVIWGGKDKLINVPVLVDLLPNCIFSKCIDHHEHMDSLTSLDALESIFKPLIALFDKY